MMLLDRFREKFPVVTEALISARASGRLSHAYLLHGDTAENRRDFSICLAQIALCQNSSKGAPCGRCGICTKLESGTYPEMYVLSPSSKSRIIPIGQLPNPEPNTLRWFEGQFYLTSSGEAGTKLGIIHDSERMNTEAQNAFLKTLEEPPANTFFILTTGNPSSLLPTTRSRCQILPMLENSCRYNFNGSDTLFSLLKELSFDSNGNIIAGEKCAEEVIELSKALKSEAAENTAEVWQPQIDQADELEDKTYRKKLEERSKIAVEAEYRRLRAYFLSAIHTWFAQAYQLSCGAPLSSLANPEIMPEVNAEQYSGREEKNFKDLSKAEKLLQNLNWSVNEELALREFCLSVAIK